MLQDYSELMDNHELIRNPRLILKNLGDEVILYDPDQKAVHVLNATAQVVWELCDGEHKLEDIEHALRSRYSVPADRDVKADIIQTLNMFISKHIVIPKMGSEKK